MSAEVFLGVAFTSGLEEVVIPFFDRGLPVEYELTRSIRVVSRSGRKKVGILTTDAKLMGGFDMRTISQTPEWSIVTELKKQYDVSSVSPDTPISPDLDVLLVAQPSSLTQKQIDNLTDYVKKGGATLLFLDPFPFDNPSISPELPKLPPGGPFGGGQPPEPKGNLRPLLDLIGIDWPSTEIVWNAYNPHPKLADLQSTPEIVFIGKGSGAATRSMPSKAPAPACRRSSTLFPGLLRPEAGARGPSSSRCSQTGPTGGTIAWSDVVQQGFMGISGINPRRRHIPTGRATRWPPGSRGSCRLTRPKTAKKDDVTKDADEEEGRKARCTAGEDQRDRDRRPGHDRRAVLRAAAQEDREPGLRQRPVRAQLRGRAGRRRVVRRAAEEAADAPAARSARSPDQDVRQGSGRQDQGGRGRGHGRARRRPRRTFDKQVDAVQSHPSWTTEPRRSSSPTSRRSPSGGSTSTSRPSKTRSSPRSARQGRVRAADPRHPKRRAVRGR